MKETHKKRKQKDFHKSQPFKECTSTVGHLRQHDYTAKEMI